MMLDSWKRTVEDLTGFLKDTLRQTGTLLEGKLVFPSPMVKYKAGNRTPDKQSGGSILETGMKWVPRLSIFSAW